MPLLDVSEVLDDPDFATCFDVRRTVTTVGQNGRVSTSEETTAEAGVITMDSGLQLNRLSDGRMVAGGIIIHSRFLLSAGFGDQEPDIVVWQGREYTVTVVGDYSQYGVGFITAKAIPRSLT